METKSKRISLSKLDKYVEDQEAFGWEVVSKEDLRPNHTVLVIMQRDKEGFGNYDKVKKLEKQYHRIARPYPIATIVLAVIGLAFLIGYLFLKQTLFFAIVFLYVSLTFFAMAIFALIVFLLILIKRRKLLLALKKEAANKSGANKDWPIERNVIQEEELTWALIDATKE